MDRSKNLSQTKASGFGMRHAGCLGRVDAVKINADVKRPLKHRDNVGVKIADGQYLHGIPFGLFAAMAGQCADADLNQSFGMPAFHDPCKRRGMATRITFKVSIDIWMSIEMENVERTISGRKRSGA